MAADFVEQSENFNNYNSFIYNNFRIFATSFLCLLRIDAEKLGHKNCKYGFHFNSAYGIQRADYALVIIMYGDN